HYSLHDELVLSFIVPVEGPELGEEHRALLARTAVSRNPTLQGIVLSLQSTMGAGEGFIVDEEGRIVAYPSGKNFQPLSRWTVAESPRQVYQTEQGLAYEDVSGVGTREIVYYLPVTGHSWAVVIHVPYSVVLAQATEISTPLLLILVLVALVSFAAIPVLTHRLTHPLQDLAEAAGQIASGRLEGPVRVSGEDEVGRLGTVFEQMRIRLQERLAELSLLLEVSQEVSRSLDLEACLSPILRGALQGTSAIAARIVIISERREVEDAVTMGPAGAAMAHFDRALAAVARADSPFVAGNLTGARGAVPAAVVQAGVQAAIGLPLRIQERTTGVMWVGYAEPHQFTEAELGFLSTLAGQAAVVAENARLFEAAESERRRLAAILASTADAIIVTDSRNRIVLINPSAAQIYRIAGDKAVGLPLNQALANESLHDLFSRALNAEGGLAEEVPSPDGRVLYASVSPISGAEGQVIGRVAVMRDITYLKELDNMKSEFVATVSHDLRSPLTFMRGYTTMISMVGQVTPKQDEFVRKILGGIDQMTALIDDLLDIGKIDAGVGIEMGPCHLQSIVRVAVDSLRSRAEVKGLSLDLEEIRGELFPLTGDEVLLRQAVTNLVDNAIKYTPAPGEVKVGIMTQDSYLVVWVKDTGVGIALPDQRRLFEKFYRIKRRDTITIKGTGLGLAIVKSIVERHNGRVWVESQLGQGSTFYIALPQTPPGVIEGGAQGDKP
ncbi:MAG: ATP-binding protein, partial [Chloroflexota bacterium]|nr:ATP-binding protein [Chloroflexota bacterium]